MLPDIQSHGEPLSIPTFDLVPSEIDGFMDALRTFQSAFYDGFARRESRAHFLSYMVGQFSHLERKSIAPMALEVEGGHIRGMQRWISEVTWDDAHMLRTYHHLVADELGDSGGVVILDETGFVKKGKASAGVARQDCRSLGHVENAQVGVFAAYASRHGYALLDKRLFMPKVWFSAAYAERRTRCQVPKALGFQGKAKLAAAMLQALSKAEQVPFKYVVVGGLYGNSPDLLDAIDTGGGVTALAAIPGDTRCWLQAPRTEGKIYRYKGTVRSKRVVVASAPAPSPVAALAASLPASSWYWRQVLDRTHGPIEYEFARKRITLCQDGLPGRTVWLVIRRPLGAQPLSAYFISNAPESTPLSLLVRLSGVGGVVAQCVEEGQTELGMSHYEVRKYPGWHHHMLTTMLAHFFLWRLKRRLGQPSPRADGVAAGDGIAPGPIPD